MTSDNRYWFAATPFGFGWWRPSHWLGWLTVVLAVTLVFLAGLQFPPTTAPLGFWSSIVGVMVIFLLACKIKGEPLGKPRV